MKGSSSFIPYTFCELVQEYAYLLVDDTVATPVRKQIKIKLSEEGVLRVYTDTLQFLMRELKQFYPKSIFVIYSQYVNKEEIAAQLGSLSYKLIEDNDFLMLLGRIQQTQECISKLAMHADSQTGKIFSNRLRTAQMRFAQYNAQLQQLENFHCAPSQE